METLDETPQHKESDMEKMTLTRSDSPTWLVDVHYIPCTEHETRPMGSCQSELRTARYFLGVAQRRTRNH